jgi:hypothetical protein
MGITINYIEITPTEEVNLMLKLYGKGCSLLTISQNKNIHLHPSGIHKILMEFNVYKGKKPNRVYFPQPTSNQWSENEMHYGKNALKYTWESLGAEERGLTQKREHEVLKKLN